MTKTTQDQAARLTDALSDFRETLMREFHNTDDEDKADTLDALVEVLFDADVAVRKALSVLS